MKKLLLFVTWVALVRVNPLSCYALPTYEPFTEFAPIIASSGSNMVCLSNGVPVGTNFGGSIPNCIDLATGGYTAPSGELWSNINYSGFSGNSGAGTVHGLDIAVISNATLFTQSALSPLLPSTFPGMPAAGQAITNCVENPAQPIVFEVTNSGTGQGIWVATNYCGNSAVLKFAQPLARPASGTKTLYWSYLISIAQKGQTGAGNDGRYLGFVQSTNLNLGSNNVSYPTWNSFFNAFGTTAGKPAYFGNAVFNGSPDYLEPVDSSLGLQTNNSGVGKSTAFGTTYNAPYFVVGELVFTTGGATSDTNVLWVNPAPSTFGGPAPNGSPTNLSAPLSVAMSDVGGLVLIDRTGNGASGGVGTNYIANLLIGSTWSYVTGGPEFINAPAANTYINAYGQNTSMSGSATAAAQSVTYQWQRVTGGVTNNLTDGPGTPGVAAAISGSTTTNLTLTGVQSGDLGTYQLMATASGTGYTLSAPTALSLYVDPHINSVPGSVNTNYGSTVNFTVQIGTLDAPLTYGWSKNGTPLANGFQPGGSVAVNATGTTGAGTNFALTLTLTNVSYLDDGSYTLNVTNSASQTNNSASASLTVIDPIIVTQPQTNIMVLSTGGTTNFSVVANGIAPLFYQWYGQLQGLLSDGSTFTGSASNTLIIANAQPANSDNYYVVVTGPGGAVQTSSNAVVYVNNTALGPFSTAGWPTSIATNSVVDYHIVDSSLAFTIQTPPSWNNVMALAPNSGDETYTTTTLGGLQCDQATATYWNFADPNWKRFVSVPQIDLLLLVYGNSDMYNATNGGLPTTYSYGITTSTPATTYYAHTGAFPLGANNGQWNWMLLTITNVLDANGYLTIGDPVAGAGSTYGGINGGTIRMEGFADGMSIAAYAFGPHGAFGTSNQVDRFANPVSCAPEPSNNLAYIDFNQNITNNLLLINNSGLGETYTVSSGVGPTNDQRTAIQPSGQLEPVILNNYLGLPCNENLSMQLSLEVYDDPALTGTQFAPYQYATDSQGDLQTYLGQYYTLTGSGKWLKIAFYFGPANLQGVNAAPLTGGCTVLFSGGNPWIDRVELGVIRTGTNALAGQIPDPSYNLAPLVTCSNGYGYYAEWYPTAGISNNVDISSGYSTTNGIGPSNDLRIAEVPNPITISGSASYEQFALLNNVFGPAYQDNADVIISLDYYDDPALGTNNDLFPNTYNTMNNGNIGVVSPQSPYSNPVNTTGTGKWKTAIWELPNVNFTGGYLCRFASSAPIYISRVRYDVIRPCGSFEGINYLQTVGAATTNHQVELSWFGQASVVSSAKANGTYSNVVSVTNLLTNTYTALPTNSAGFFRIQFPSYPTNLSPYIP